MREASRTADETWAGERNVSGLSSGEGLISHVRDEVRKWNAKERCEEIIDPGVRDKRLMVTEAEFAGTLTVMGRSGNNLSPVIRNAWDGLLLQTMTKNSPLKATGAHISIVGHITKDELRAKLTRTDMANGFANRFLFCLVKRSKLLPHGGCFDDMTMAKLAARFAEAVAFARKAGRVHMTDAAAKVWAEAYAELSADRPGLLGAVTARAEAQVIRLSLIFALLDSKDQIDTVHLQAAMAVWAYCDQSAHLIFGDSLGDPVADDILIALRRNVGGMILQLGDGDPQTAGAVLHGMFGLAPATEDDDPRVIDPDVVKHIGHGSVAAGQKVLRKFVAMLRRQGAPQYIEQPDGNHGRIARPR